ncbi:hypothetical protein ACHAXR_005122, partial [Thalassiosira sp. AJA248-18]
KKECKKRAAEIFDEALFKTHPKEDCPICCLPLPIFSAETKYQACCGKLLCNGCFYANVIARQSTEQICPFCRTPAPTSGEAVVERIRKRIEAGDAYAMYNLGCSYIGEDDVPLDSSKALELWHQSAKLGCAASHDNIGGAYMDGEGVEMDVKKAKYHWEQGAMGGNVLARHNLGFVEGKAGNTKRALKHFMISAELGCDYSLEEIHYGFSKGRVTKDDFEKALRAHKKSKDEMQSDQRDAARHYLQRIRLHP